MGGRGREGGGDRGREMWVSDSATPPVMVASVVVHTRHHLQHTLTHVCMLDSVCCPPDWGSLQQSGLIADTHLSPPPPPPPPPAKI